ncbi:MAG: gamma carbonic anhydrase family protein [Candidatus Thermoplasmatota archaeon]|nr:gamma carbonic anhydrase family protein [Candidatus Thermoplasmatota archaeon]MBU1940606.1 gamma carbonic anhydrase family protein [Candidatus Thermoplasmatota archaeon]
MKIDASSFIDESAVIIGNVTIGKQCGVFPHAVIRGDQNSIVIDDGSNVQDCCIVHTDKKHAVFIGKNVSLGHCSMVHGAYLEEGVLIGINATVLNGARIGRGSIIGANALVTTNMEVPPFSLVLGVPGKIIKQDESFYELNLKNAETYQQLSLEHKNGKHPHLIR